MFYCVTEATNTKKENDETFLLSRTNNRHSSVDNLHTHCNRCMLVDVGRAGRLIYFGYARCPVPMCLVRLIHGSIRFFRCTRFHSNSP